MVLREKQYTSVEEFERWVDLPENADKHFEYIGGEIIEVPSNALASKYSSRINGYFFVYLLENDIAHLTGENGGFKVSGERYAPDVAITLRARQDELSGDGYNPISPDLAVEVDYPSSYQSQEQLRIKVANYLAAGTIVWVVRPELTLVEVYEPGLPVRFLFARFPTTCAKKSLSNKQ